MNIYEILEIDVWDLFKCWFRKHILGYEIYRIMDFVNNVTYVYYWKHYIKSGKLELIDTYCHIDINFTVDAKKLQKLTNK